LGGVEDYAGEVDQVAFVQELENPLMRLDPDPPCGTRWQTALHGLRRPETRWQRSPGAASDTST